MIILFFFTYLIKLSSYFCFIFILIHSLKVIINHFLVANYVDTQYTQYYIIPTKRAELSKIIEKWPGKKVVVFFVRTREITDIFNTFDEIYLVFTSKK